MRRGVGQRPRLRVGWAVQRRLEWEAGVGLGEVQRRVGWEVGVRVGEVGLALRSPLAPRSVAGSSLLPPPSPAVQAIPAKGA